MAPILWFYNPDLFHSSPFLIQLEWPNLCGPLQKVFLCHNVSLFPFLTLPSRTFEWRATWVIQGLFSRGFGIENFFFTRGSKTLPFGGRRKFFLSFLPGREHVESHQGPGDKVSGTIFRNLGRSYHQVP